MDIYIKLHRVDRYIKLYMDRPTTEFYTGIGAIQNVSQKGDIHRKKDA